MGNLWVDYAKGSGDTDRGRSPGLWKGSHWDEIVGGNYTQGMHWGDDFQSTPVTAARYTLTEGDATASIGPVLTGDDGGLVFAMTTTDNQEANLNFTVDSSTFCQDIDTNSTFEVYFEARWKVSSVADDYIAAYVGLAEAGLTGANMQTDDTGVLSVKDFLMHRTVHTNGGTTGTNAVLDAVFATSAGAEVDLKAASDTLVADTYVKTGFKFDGRTKVQEFINGVAGATSVAPAATNFPNGEKLTFACGAKLGSAVTASMTLDWWHAIVRKPSARS
jgi:hypothetical protein